MASYLKPSLFAPSMPSFGRSNSDQPNGRVSPYPLRPLLTGGIGRAAPPSEMSLAPSGPAGYRSSGFSAVGGRIKCSDCGSEVRLENLGEHVCSSEALAPVVRQGELLKSSLARQCCSSWSCRVDGRLSPRPQTPPTLSQSPVSLDTASDAFKPGMTRSDSSSSARSIESIASTSTTSRMPFFEKYAKLTERASPPSRSGSAADPKTALGGISPSSWGTPATLTSSPTLERFAQPPSTSPSPTPSSSSSSDATSPATARSHYTATSRRGGPIDTPETSPESSSSFGDAHKPALRLGGALPRSRGHYPHDQPTSAPRAQYRPPSPPMKAQLAAMNSSRSAGSGLDRLLATQAKDDLLYPSAGATREGIAGRRSPSPVPARDSSHTRTHRTSSVSHGLPDRTIHAPRGLVAPERPALHTRGTDPGPSKSATSNAGLKIKIQNGSTSVTPPSSVGSTSSSLSSRFKGVGLEGLMGDLMAEMDGPRAPGKGQAASSQAAHSADDEDDEDMFSVDAYGDDDRTPRPSDVAVMPTSASDVHPDDSISQRDPLPSPLPLSPTDAKGSRKLGLKSSWRDSTRCEHCRKPFSVSGSQKVIRQTSSDPSADVAFCKPCYADLYLPKCRKCDRPIEKGAVTDRVGKVLGKYHPKCFNCFKCSATFPDGEFYVWERKPVVSLESFNDKYSRQRADQDLSAVLPSLPSARGYDMLQRDVRPRHRGPLCGALAQRHALELDRRRQPAALQQRAPPALSPGALHLLAHPVRREPARISLRRGRPTVVREARGRGGVHLGRSRGEEGQARWRRWYRRHGRGAEEHHEEGGQEADRRDEPQRSMSARD